MSARMSGTKKEPKPKLLSPDIFRLGRGLPREGVGAKKFGTSLETREIKFFCQDIRGFCRDVLEAHEKFEKKTFVFNFRSLECGESPLETFFQTEILSKEFWGPCRPKPSLTKPPFPIFRSFSRWIVRRFCLFHFCGCVLQILLSFEACPGLIHIFLI